jgi:hypothetical protein
MWQVCLAEIRADATTYRVALHLLDKAAFSNPVTLSNQGLAKCNVSRASKWRALETLRQAGLVAISERAGKSPLVTVRWT